MPLTSPPASLCSRGQAAAALTRKGAIGRRRLPGPWPASVISAWSIAMQRIIRLSPRLALVGRCNRTNMGPEERGR